MSVESILMDIVELQAECKNLIAQHNLTPKGLRDLVIPFRDKYKITDLQAFEIARDKVGIAGIIEFIEAIKERKGE